MSKNVSSEIINMKEKPLILNEICLS